MSEQSSASYIPEWDQADRMRKALRHAGVGVQELAAYLDVSRNTVGTWINGRVNPDTRTLRLVALRCGVPYEWLRDGIEPTPHPDGTASDQPGRKSGWIYEFPAQQTLANAS